LSHQNTFLRLKAANPHLTIVINGGITSASDALEHLQYVDGVMCGRGAYGNPWWMLSQVDNLFYGSPRTSLCRSREEALERLKLYIQQHMDNGGEMQDVARHIVGLYSGAPGARVFRQYVTVNMRQSCQLSLLDNAIAMVVEAVRVQAETALEYTAAHRHNDGEMDEDGF
jgi:tRNA-dihydrouridine synthase A